METALVLGFGLMLIGAICGGSFGLPSKYAKEGTPWEVLWGPFFLFVTILIPVVVAPLVVSDLGSIYSTAGTNTILAVLAFGGLAPDAAHRDRRLRCRHRARPQR